MFSSDSFNNFKENAKGNFWEELVVDWKWIFSHTAKHRKNILSYALLGLLSTSMSVLLAYLIKQLINVVVAGQYEAVPFFVIILVCGLIISPAVNAAAFRVSASITIDITNDIQAEIFEKVLNSKWMDIRHRSTGDLINRINSDVKVVASNAVRWIPNLIINFYSFLLTFILLWRIDFIMALISLLAAPFLLFSSRFLLGRLKQQKKAVNELDSDMMSFETEAFGNFDMIKSFGISEFFSEKLSDWHAKSKKTNLDYNTIQIGANVVMDLTSGLVTIIALGYSLYRLSLGTLLFGDMTFFLTQRSNVSYRVQSIMSAVPGMLNSSVSAHRIRELTEVDVESSDETSFQQLSKELSKGLSVVLDNVSFSYNNQEDVYCNTSFTARPGEIATIIGPSGEGKTTLLRMILGLISPSQGQIYMQNNLQQNISITAETRKLISYVPQGAALLAGSIADNMRMGKKDAGDEEIISALKAACAWDFVEKLPSGINTKVGEKSAGLSEGQSQRISIARAILRDAPILILDEATSALDSETESRVIDNIMTLAKNKTCIVSTQRLSILKKSNHIYKVEHKKLIEIAKEDVAIE